MKHPLTGNRIDSKSDWQSFSLRAALTVLLLAPLAALQAIELTLTSPLEHEVVQRSTPGKGLLRITGKLSDDLPPGDFSIEARLSAKGQDTPSWRVSGSVTGRMLKGSVEVPSGGWWRLEVRISQAGQILASSAVEPIGIGEVFVIAGQSNSANHGEEKQRLQSGRVAAFDGTGWRIADDPQPGASGGGGSFIPAFADAVVAKENVPVGIIACGIGATSVREWLPKGATFPNPPTIEKRVEQRPDGSWSSNGAAYDTFIARMKSMGPQGFRAVLWHQGESDANQKDATRTLPGKLYREYLEKIIRDSRRDIGWDAPWFVAQASYHVPGDEGSDEIRAAQASLWKDGIALEGPDSDALKGKLRERDGQGVHFSGPGLREHGARWAEKVLPWLDQHWTAPRQANGGTEWSNFASLPECHSLGWVSANVQSKKSKSWDGVLDETKWGTPDPQQVVGRNWDWKVSEEQWREAVKQKGEGRREEVRLDLWLPDGVTTVKGIVVISGHGTGQTLFRRADLRALAKELHLGLFKFVGNPMQRGFWPQTLLLDHLKNFGEATDHPELGHKINGDLLGSKFGVWEGGHRVPFIAWWPGKIPPGTVSNQLLSSVDLMATVAAILGRELSDAERRDSINMLPALTGNPEKALRTELVACPHKDSHLSLRKGKWMYIPAQSDGGFTGSKPDQHAWGGAAVTQLVGTPNSDIENGKIKPDAFPAQLYDLEADRNQTTNLYNEKPEVVAEMAALLKSYRNATPLTSETTKRKKKQ